MKKTIFNIPLINSHTHAAMMPMRGRAEDLPLNEWLQKHIWPYEAKYVNAKFVYEHTKAAIKEMKVNGIRAFCDMYFFEEEVARAAEEEKIPVVLGEALLDFPTPSCQNPQKNLEKTEKLIKKYQNHPFIKVSVAPHSIYTVSKKNLIKAKKLAKKYDVIYQIHLAETKKEFDNCKKQHNMTPIEYLDSLGCLDEKSLLHHVVWATDSDIKILAKKKSTVVHCPLSNLKLGSGIAPVSKLIKAGINVALGTDGAASSNRLDIWEAGKIAALLQKVIHLDPTHIPANKIFEMMSTNGIKALNYDIIDNKNILNIKKEIDKFNTGLIYELNIGEMEIK